jgi:hypothetical protein
MIAEPDDHVDTSNESEWALQVVALVTAIAIVAAGFFILNSASREYRLVNADTPPALNSVPLAAPTTNPTKAAL